MQIFWQLLSLYLQKISQQFLDSLPTVFSKNDAEHLANTLGVSVGTMGNWLTTLVQMSIIQRNTKG